MIHEIATPRSHVDITKKYASGDRNFEKADLKQADLRGVDLSFANLRGADLRKADLSHSILIGADLQGAKLDRATLNGARLQGANLSETSITWGLLMAADLSGANLQGASLDAANLTQSTLQGANLSGTYLNSADLRETVLKDAYYNDFTRFESDFDPIAMGMRCQTQLTVEQVLDQLNALSLLSSQYLGSSLVSRYWTSSRLLLDGLNQFEIVNRSAQIVFSGVMSDFLEVSQLQRLQLWINAFIHQCLTIVHNFPKLIERQRLIVTLSLLDSGVHQVLGQN